MQKVLLEEINPFGNIQAVVESNGKACYFYLYGAPEIEFGLRHVWVRNLVPAPEALDVNAMRAGEAPANPGCHCNRASASIAPKPEDLRVVWLPEGNGAALYEREEIVAIIPPWSGVKGFAGYAREAVGEGPLAWELRSDNALLERFERAGEYWRGWEGEVWTEASMRLTSNYADAYGKYSNYYAIDGGEWPPRALIRIPYQEGVILATIGMSLLLQPNVEMAVSDPSSLRRIELAAYVPANWSEDNVKQLAQYISAQSRLPWTSYTWLGSGHTIPCDSWRNRDFTMAALIAKHPAVRSAELSSMNSDPVSMLWLLPISETERQVAINSSSALLIEHLPADRWKAA